jgi:hypothetical protein
MDINKNKDRARNTDKEVPSNPENLTRGDVARGATGIPNVESTSSSDAKEAASNPENLTRGDVARGATGIPNVENLEAKDRVVTRERKK